MSEDSTEYEMSDADVFSRGSLKLSYDLLRQANPSLALQVRNIISGEPLPKEGVDNTNKNSDHFRVTLDSFQVRAVVEGLMAYNQNEVLAKKQPGLAVMAKALMEDWIVLARKMVSELPAHQRP
ncbi:MAG: hypothetical protein RPR40_01675 [Bermanella sp.]